MFNNELEKQLNISHSRSALNLQLLYFFIVHDYYDKNSDILTAISNPQKLIATASEIKSQYPEIMLLVNSEEKVCDASHIKKILILLNRYLRYDNFVQLVHVFRDYSDQEIEQNSLDIIDGANFEDVIKKYKGGNCFDTANYVFKYFASMDCEVEIAGTVINRPGLSEGQYRFSKIQHTACVLTTDKGSRFLIESSHHLEEPILLEEGFSISNLAGDLFVVKEVEAKRVVIEKHNKSYDGVDKLDFYIGVDGDLEQKKALRLPNRITAMVEPYHKEKLKYMKFKYAQKVLKGNIVSDNIDAGIIDKHQAQVTDVMSPNGFEVLKQFLRIYNALPDNFWFK